MSPTLELPRAVLLALWLQNGPSAGARDRIVGDDEPHDVLGVPYAGLDDLLDDLGGNRRDVAALLPRPGDPLVGPPEAAAFGECVLVHDDEGRSLGIVPEVRRFGSRFEPGAMVTWHVRPIPDWRTAALGVVGSVDDAERDLREGLLLATRALVELDVARWRPDAAERIAVVRDGDLPARRLPPVFAAWPQRVRVMTQAARLREIVALATEDEGGAVNLWQSDQRSTALREVDRLARRALGAAATWVRGDGAVLPDEPQRRPDERSAP